MANNNNQDNSKGNLKLYLLNCNSINTKLGEIKDFLATHKPDIFCFTETWLNKYIPRFNNYVSHWKHRDSADGGLGIVIEQSIPHTTYPLPKWPPKNSSNTNTT